MPSSCWVPDNFRGRLPARMEMSCFLASTLGSPGQLPTLILSSLRGTTFGAPVTRLHWAANCDTDGTFSYCLGILKFQMKPVKWPGLQKTYNTILLSWRQSTQIWDLVP
ncbi:uncharacterized protein ACBT57_006653 [Dama dama]